MMGALVLAAAYRTNAEAIADCAKLGYLKDDDLVLDATYGIGRWWTKRRPRRLVTSDLDRRRPADLHADFRALPFPDETFNVGAFDPSYCPPGGRTTTTIGEMHDRYGMTDMPRTPAAVQALINAGLDEHFRCVRRGGIVLAKCKSYITSGIYQHQEYETTRYALDKLGFEIVDRLFVMQRTPGPQSQTRQVHARNNASTLLVLRRP
jgi:hypothetical protein